MDLYIRCCWGSSSWRPAVPTASPSSAPPGVFTALRTWAQMMCEEPAVSLLCWGRPQSPQLSAGMSEGRKVSSSSVPLVKLASLISISALDGCPLSDHPVSHLTRPISLDLSPLHIEQVQSYALSAIHAPLVLGLPRFHWASIEYLSTHAHCPIQIRKVLKPFSFLL